MGETKIFLWWILFNGVFTDGPWGHFHLIWLLSRDGWHWLWRHPQWWLSSGSFQDQTASCYLKPTAAVTEPNIREISYLTRELSWAYGFHDDSNFLTLFVCLTKSISSNFSRIYPSSVMMLMLLMFLTLESLVTGMPRRNSKYAKDWVQLDKDHWRGHVAKTVKKTRWELIRNDFLLREADKIWFSTYRVKQNKSMNYKVSFAILIVWSQTN